LLGYLSALVIWSALGAVVLYWGARRFGFARREAWLIVLSPASAACIYYGQTGNAATGLLLLALSARTQADPLSAGAATLLTVKPQLGFLLPVLWAIQQRWRLIALTAAAALLLLGASLLLLGSEAWRAYGVDTLPLLSRLEREGSGPFMLMIPSVFMAARILLQDGTLAMQLHVVFAAVVLCVLIWRLVKTTDRMAQSAVVLVGTALITPYIHNYDLSVLLCGALLVTHLHPGRPWTCLPLAVAWIMPVLVMILNAAGAPMAPLLMLLILLSVGGRAAGRSPTAADAPPGAGAR
jgi:hypothetical protein